jgi:hypothetical protein
MERGMKPTADTEAAPRREQLWLIGGLLVFAIVSGIVGFWMLAAL